MAHMLERPWQKAEVDRNDTVVKDPLVLLFGRSLLSSDFSPEDVQTQSDHICHMIKLGWAQMKEEEVTAKETGQVLICRDPTPRGWGRCLWHG